MWPPGEEPPSPVFQSTLCPMACMALHWRHSSKYWKHYWSGFFFPPSEYLQISSSWIVSKQYQKRNTICQRGLSKDKIPGVPRVQIDHCYSHDAESIFGFLLFQECQDMPYLKRNACIIYMTHTHPFCYIPTAKVLHLPAWICKFCVCSFTLKEHFVADTDTGSKNFTVKP